MTIPRWILTAATVALLAVGFSATPAKASHEEPLYSIPPEETDPAIGAGRGNHLVWLPADPSRRNGKLLVFMPGGGANNFPQDWKELGTEGARLGYHTVLLAYKNDVRIADPAACGNAEEPPLSKPNCAINARQEILDGSNSSEYVIVDRANSIENRLIKLLQYLARDDDDQGWRRFVDTSGAEPAPNWPEITVGGQSLGAGQAVLIAMQQPVHRVGVFAGFADAKHGWVELQKTPSERFFALVHRRDNFFARTCYASLALQLVSSCPMPGFADRNDTANPLLVEHRSPPYDGAHVLVTNLEPAKLTDAIDPYHTSTARDQWTPRVSLPDGAPLLANAWRHVLGTDTDGDGVEHDADNCAAQANPDQENTDGDVLGDVCDPDDDNKVAGDGWIGEAKNSFSFTAQYGEGMESPKGNVTYQDETAGLELKSVELTSVIVYSATRAVILGTATVNGQDTEFRLDVEDYGEPGENDTFRIAWSGYEAGGVLNGGNIQIRSS